MINYKVLELVKKLNPAAVQKVVAGFQEFFKNNEFVIDPKQITLHITHIDSDALGCVLAVNTLVNVEEMKFKERYGSDRGVSQVITIYAPEYCSEDVVIAACEFFYMVYGSNPKRLVVSDIFVSPAVMNKAINTLFGIENPKMPTDRTFFVSNLMMTPVYMRDDCIQILYVDHHKTNPCVDKIATGEYVFSDETKYLMSYYLTVSTAGNYVKWKQFMHENHPLLMDDEQFEFDFCGIGEKDPDTRISAALLVMESIMDVLREEPLETSYTATFLQLRTVENDISQWDTFEWRDHPQYNFGFEKTFAYASYIMRFEDMNAAMINHYRKMIEDGGEFHMGGLIPSEIHEASNAGLGLHIKAVEKMKSEAKLISFGYVFKEVYPDLWQDIPSINTDAILVTFPDSGNSSLIFHDLMQDMSKNYPNKILVCISKKLTDATVSFRSNNDIDVSEVAKILGGGGHAQASGCNRKELADKLRSMIR